ncbi:hypothetical protein ACFX13_016791 [Malus domestica]|uniref:MYB domain class transcription factor n=2 Tax=Malus TaxID=3749 RepID=A0A498HV10_MALDO|nr:transcription factor MYB114-like [Malus domestica]RXH73021.1 hypothetical protein DVH24_012705 [Malus domestica]
MVPVSSRSSKKDVNRGSWTAEEDQKLAQVIEIHGPRRWKSIATKAGLKRCGKSCRLRWMNYLRPNIKRGNISDQEEDLILRLHKLLGNRWSLIAGRLPGRTDNEIKNYWNSHLSKKMKQNRAVSKTVQGSTEQKNIKANDVNALTIEREDAFKLEENFNFGFNGGQFFNCSSSEQGPLNLEWMNKFLEMDESWFTLHDI